MPEATLWQTRAMRIPLAALVREPAVPAGVIPRRGKEVGEMGLLSVAESRPSVSLAGRRILVMEDEYFLADDIGRVLSSSGASVLGPFNEVADATRLLDGDTPVDAAILDINLRSEMVFPLALALRARGIPFIFTTGYDRRSIDPEFHDVTLWEKPLDYPALLRSLGGMMRKG